MNRVLFHAACLFSVAVFAAPTTEPDTIAMHHSGKARIEVLANDDATIDPATVVVAQPPQFGSATPDSSGRILYTHTSGVPSADSFTYQASDASGQSAPTTVTVQFPGTLRVPPHGFHVPLDPPPSTYQLTPTFGSLTFNIPVAVVSPPGDTRRLFVCELTGLIRLIPDVTAATPTTTTFLNLAALLASRVGETLDLGLYWEDGLLGLAFHPQHAQNGTFFISYTMRKADGVFYARLSRFQVQPGNPNLADPASEVILIEQLDEERNHNGGDLHFGPDGYLYFCVGDEGDQFDSRNNSQRIDRDFFSGIFRIDVDKKPGSLAPNPHAGVPLDDGVARYAVPPDNPFVGATTFNGEFINAAAVRTELWATGMRAPWRFCFDPATGELWVGDVGQYHYEEVNLIVRGGNYGWAIRDGAHAGFRPAPPGFTSIDPVYEYEHTNYPGDPLFKGNAVIGGVVYHGDRFAALEGAYVFGDWGSGNVWALRRDGGTVSVEWLAAHPGLNAFGLDPSNGDVLVVTHGSLRRLTSGTPTGTFPQTLSQTGLFADLTDLAPNPGLLPFEPNVSFWSDHAIKRRWFAMPDTTSLLGWARDDAWTFPSGALWVKHFDLEMERDNPLTKRRIETRVLMKNDTGIYGVSYRWNEEQTEAVLVPTEGADFPLNITENGTPRTQMWHIPSRGECLACHNPAAGFPLSFNTRQLNRIADMDGFIGNQLDLLRIGGFFSNSPPSPNLLPRHVRLDETEFSVEARARSYLAVNCSQCHRPGGAAPQTWDARAERTLAETLLIDGTPVNNGGNSANKLIVPGDSAHSIVLNRLAAANGFTRMPPIATNEIDADGCALLAQWITSSLTTRQTYEQWRQAKFGSSTSIEGERTADPDGDGRDNAEEFIAATEPTIPDQPALPALSLAGDVISLSGDIPAHRAFQVETSSDLIEWSLWDVPGNHGVARSGPVTLVGPRIGLRQFFRFRLSEP